MQALMTQDTQTTRKTFSIPGTREEVVYERDASGRLLRLSAGGRTYLHTRDGERVFEDGMATVREASIPSGMLRHVQAAGEAWVEEYLWDDVGRPVRVDGVRIERDGQGRVTACRSEAGDWLYAYAGDHLAVIDGPFGTRHVARGAQGRPTRVREGAEALSRTNVRERSIAYDGAGRRLDAPALPENWHRDDLGRLWTITEPDGTVRTTYLWDGFACLGRIDGAPGEPLAAVFCLDPTCTPVRVITREGVTRIPRDAYGEGLLRFSHIRSRQDPGVPGLYGGAVYGGFVHLRSRRLDPRTGSFDAPDPWHGREGDPRREGLSRSFETSFDPHPQPLSLSGRGEGMYRGPLRVEETAAGPYAVCRYDPVGRVDPTGEVSAAAVGLFFLDISWALQNNVAGFLGLDWTLGLTLSLFFSVASIFSSDVPGLLGRFFDFEGVASERIGTWALRRDGFWTYLQEPRAWTYGHLMFETEEGLASLNDVHVFRPSSAFVPTLYGTLLLVRPEGHDPFVLNTSWSTDGTVRPVANGWSRAGGTAESVIPGSLVPHFPAGGVHFDSVREGLRGPRNGVLTELNLSNVLALGTLINRTIVTLSGTGLGIAVGDLLLLTRDTQGAAIIVVQTVEEEGGRTRITAQPPYASQVEDGAVRVRSLDPTPTSTQILNIATDINGNRLTTHLNLLGALQNYDVGDPLRISQNAMELAGAVVVRRETQLLLDATMAGGTLSQPMSVFLGSIDPSAAPVNATVVADPAGGGAPPVLQFNAGQAPGVPSAALLTHAVSGATRPVAVTADAGGNMRRLDRDLTAGGFAAVGDTLRWQPLRRDAAVGRQDAPPDAAATFTYAPDDLLFVPPAAGLIWAEGGGGLSVRQVTGTQYVAIVLNAGLPGNPTQVYSVERFAFRTSGTGAIDQNSVGFRREQEVTLNTPATITGEALQVQRYLGANAATIPSTPDLAGFTIDPATPTLARGNLNAGQGNNTPTPAQVVLLNPGPGAALAVVQRVRMTITFNRQIRLTNTANLETVPLDMYHPVYNAERLGALRVRVLGTMGTPPAPVAAPILRPGEQVVVRWQTPNASNTFTVAAVTADMIDLVPPATGPTLPAGGTNFTLQRFVPNAWPYDAVRQGDFLVTVLATDELPLRRLPPDPDTAFTSVGVTVAAPLVLQFPAGQAPAVGAEGVLTLAASGARRIVVVTEDAGGDMRRIDRDLTVGNFAAVGDNLTWQQIRPENRRVQMPRFQVGELVEVSWGSMPPGAPIPVAAEFRQYRVAAVEGTTLTLADDNDPLPPITPDLLVTRLSPLDPGTGGSRVGIRGMPVGGTPGPGGTTLASQIQFDVWRPSDFPPGQRIAIVDGDRCHAAAVSRTAQKAVEVEFTSAPGVAGAVNIASPVLQDSGYSVSFTQPDDAHIVLQEPPVLNQPGGALVAIVPFVDGGAQVEGELHPGTVLVPQDTEYPERTRRQSLIDHELTHTVQAITYGPIMLGFFPLWVVELVLELATDVELPQFSAYVSGEVTTEEGGGETVRLLRLDDTQAVPFETGDAVEISRGAMPERFKLGSRREDGRFVIVPIPPGSEIAPGTRVQVRRENTTAWSWFLEIANFLTLGGITKTVAGFTYGGLFLGLCKAIYGLYRLIKGTSDTYPATVEENGTRLRLENEAARSALRGARQVVIRSGGDTTVRNVQSIAEGVVNLAQPTEFRGAVGVALFATHTPGDLWDWNDYFPASIPDPARPARIRIERVGEERIELAPFDRVLISDGAREHRTYVTVVEPETPADPENPPFTRVEVAEPPFILDPPRPRVVFDTVVEPDRMGVRLGFHEGVEEAIAALRNARRVVISVGPQSHLRTIRLVTGFTEEDHVLHFDRPLIENFADGPYEFAGHVDVWPIGEEFRIAKIGSRDPMGDAVNAALHFTDMEWMRWVFDPWGNIPFRAQPNPGSFLDVLTRIGRYAFSTQAWTLLPPMLPPFGWFWWDRAFRGDSDYLSQIEQEASEESGDLYTQLARLNGEVVRVGDIARYWYFLNDRTGSVIAGGRQDAPGVHLRGFPFVSPFVTDTAPAARPEPNQGFETDPARAAVSGLALPDVFYAKGPNHPNQAPATNPVGFTPSDRGRVPTSTALERTCGNYVAFSRPGRHRATVGNRGDDDSRHSREVQQETRFASDKPRQTIWFDMDVADVSVRLGGQLVREGATITLLQAQRAGLAADPATVPPCTVSLARPATGTLLRADSNDTAVVAQTANGVEPAEIVRLYRPGDAGYPGGLGARGMHLGGDVSIPVRQFRIRVTDTLLVLGALPADLDSDPYALDPGVLRPGGEVFVLVPAPVISRALDPVTYTTTPRPAVVTDPNPQIAAEDTGASLTGDLAAFIPADGRVYRITLDMADPPEEEGIVSVLRVAVGQPASNVEVRARIPVQPHFRLTSATGLEVARGGTLTLSCSGGVQAASAVTIIPSGGITASVAGSDVTLTIAADAATGMRQILVADAADGTRRARRTIRVV